MPEEKPEVKRVSVVGSGTMGSGIAQVFAFYGFKVTLIDLSEEFLQRGIKSIENSLQRLVAKERIAMEQKEACLNNLSLSAAVEEGVKDSDLVIEAITESEEIKTELFKNLGIAAPSRAILASNTSSIPITRLAAASGKPGMVVGMHFMNPVPVMKLVEVIRGYSTSNETVQTVVHLTKKLNKIPVEVNDYPGFISNRLLMPFINEAIESLYHGVAGVNEIDTIMKLGMAHPMGPLELADFIGLDVCLAILKVLHKNLGNPKYAPCPLLQNMVAAGKLGKKTGIGFYDYGKSSKAETVAAQFTAHG